MAGKDLVSIIIPAYNAEKTFVKCVCSAAEQTYDHMEIVVVDDGSSDRTGEICMSLKKKYNNLLYYRKENGGVCSARNLGINVANGKYLFFMDSDDMIHVDTIALLVNRLHEYGSQLACIQYVFAQEQETSNCSVLSALDTKCHVYSRDEAIVETLKPNCSILRTAAGKLFIKELISREFDVRYNLAEDTLFTLQYMIECKTIVNIDSPKYIYNYDANRHQDITRLIKNYGVYKVMEDDLKEKVPSKVMVYFYLRVLGNNKEIITAAARCRAISLNSLFFVFRNILNALIKLLHYTL